MNTPDTTDMAPRTGESTAPIATHPRRKLALDAAILVAVAILGALAYYGAPLLVPRTDIALPLSSCDLGKGSCTIELPRGGSAEVEISPRPIPALKPLQVSVTVRGRAANKVEVDFAGVDMQMGYNRPQLARGSDGRFSAQANLPVCVTGSMPWQATVMIDTGSSVIAAPFRFDAQG